MSKSSQDKVSGTDMSEQLVLGLMTGLPTCAVCYLPATRRALFEGAASWLVCDQVAHETGLWGDRPLQLEELQAAEPIRSVWSILGSRYAQWLIEQELRRLRLLLSVIVTGTETSVFAGNQFLFCLKSSVLIAYLRSCPISLTLDLLVNKFQRQD